ncbi:MAG TPA: PEGA domain-containing protein [Candidatus Sulfotelmatobacter sp.]|jgi:hypothetical protein|nr:PEGA domain-containing protein [Candidatus Sulfotelmatobacter sp.]
MKKILSLTVSLALVMPVMAAQSNSQEPAGVAAGSRFVLEDGTPIKLVLSETISSADTTVGQTIPFEVVEDVMVDGIVVVPKGGNAWATVTDAQPKRRMGRGGKLDLNIDKVRLVDGSKTLLSAVKNTKGGSHTGAMTGAIVATSLIVWPAAPFFLFMHGKDITIPKGTAITAFVQGDDVLDRSRFDRQARLVTPVAPKQQPVAQPPAIDQSTSAGQSVADAARQNRANKSQQQDQSQQQAQQQGPNQ